MKKATKTTAKQQLEQKLDSVSEDTLEFLSLDDDMIEAYGRQMQEASSRKKKAQNKKKEKPHSTKTVKSSKKHKIREVREVDLDDDIDDLEDEELEQEDFGEEVYASEDFETEELEEIEEIEEIEDDEEDVDGAYYENERYYEEDEDEDDDERYYEEVDDEEDDDERYYEEIDEDEEDDDEAYYEDERYYEEDDDDEDDDERYYEDEYYEDEDDDDYESGNIFTRLGDFIANMSTLDHVVVLFGCFILIAAVATGALYMNARAKSGQVEAFAEICNEAENIKVIGESGLLAVSNAESMRLSQMFLPENENENQNEEVFLPEETQSSSIEIAMNLTSIQSDLKIKFVNKQTNKLIGGIPFEVNVTGDNGKSFTLKDEDKDGVIYQTGVSAGSYTVTAVALNGADYEKYTFPSRAETIKVTDTIAYKKVDVSDEIKSEAEVNAAAEDTAQQDTVIESTLKDTVEWVESTRLELDADNNYQEIQKNDVPDPATIGKTGTFMKTGAVSSVETSARTGNDLTDPGDGTGQGSGNTGDGNEGSNTGNEGGNTGNEGGNTGNEGGNTGNEGGNTGNEGGNTGNEGGNTGNEGGNTGNEGDNSGNEGGNTGNEGDNSGNEGGNTGTTTPTTPTNPNPPAQTKYTITGITGSLTVQVGKTGTISVTTNPAGGTVTWESDKPTIAEVNSSGVVTGKSVGTATITASIDGSSKQCTVTVTAADVIYKSVSITGTNTISVGKSETFKATTDPVGGTVTWSSDNEKIAKVDKNGVVTGVSVGKANIIATCGAAKNAYTVTIVNSRSTDTVTKLKDKNGNQLYVKEADGKYREAVYADYYKDQKLYLRKANAVCFYTGWQSIDGYTYFFDKNGNVVTGEQVIQGAKYSFGSDGKLSSGSGVLGIDVSKWNGSIDWNAVKNSGISYVIIRCGYRGSSTGALIEDPKFKSNIQGAKAAGLKVGVYFFSQAVNEVEAVEEASMALNLVNGYGLNYPIFLDVESSGGRGDKIDAGTRTAVCKAFCSTIQNSGYTAGIYANKTWFTSYINTGSLTGYKIWLAQYAATPSYTASRYDMWQYSSKGTVGGISGSVDMNISYMNY